MGGGSHQGDQIHAIGVAQAGHLVLFLVGQIRDDDAVHAHFQAFLQKPLLAVGEHRVHVRHKYHRNVQLGPHLGEHGKQLVRGAACCQRPLVRLLDDRAFRRGIGEGNAHLDEIGPGLCHGHQKLCGGVKIRVSCGDKRNECFLIFKCLVNSTHRSVPPDILRWPPHPCLRGRKY